jgi:PAS domain S-box-containing protein
MQLDELSSHLEAKCLSDDGARAAVATSLSQPVREDDRADAAPHGSERLFQVAFERAVIGIAHISPEGRFLRFNQRLCEFLGYSPEELAARTAQEVTYPDDCEPCAASYQRLLAGAIDEYAMDKRFLRKDGTAVWAHVAVSLVRSPEGTPDFTVTMIQDIDERKRLEQERSRLLEREQAARAQVEATNAQLRAIQALTDTALSHLTLDDLLHELLDRVMGVMGVDQVGILLLEEDGRTLTLRSAGGLLKAAPGYDHFALWQGFPGRIAATRESLIVNEPSADDFDGAPPALRERLHSAAGVPLLVEDPTEEQAATHAASRLVGVLIVGSATPFRFTEADVQLLQRAADRIALAIDRARLYAAERGARRCAEEVLARAQASEAQATERAERLNTILETMADGVAVYDTEGRPVQLVNRAYRELFAVERGPAEYEDLTTSERQALLDVRHAATGATLPFAQTPVGRALRGEVVTGPSADVRARAFDGRELDVNDSAAPLRDGNGQIVGVVVVLRDMTERNRLAREREEAREQAERQADQLDRIFEAAADGLLVWDAEGRLVRVNPAARRMLSLDAAPPSYSQLPLGERLALYAARDEHGRPLLSEKWPVMRTLRADVGAGIETGIEAGPKAHELRMRALDGRQLELNIAAAPLHDREGRLVGAVSVLHDMTERNRLAREHEAARADELAAREASRRMEAFLATAAHDLRTPLTAVVGYLTLTQRASERLATAVDEASPALVPAVAAVRDRLGNAGAGADRLVRLLNLLFDRAAIRAGKLELHRALCDLVALVHAQVEAMRMAAPDRVIRLHVSAAGRTAAGESIPGTAGTAYIPVEADADRIGQVVANYLTNALKYSAADRPVDIGVVARGSRARVMVCDQGPGIPKWEQARVWELFHRVPGVAVQDAAPGGTAGGSLGLGLHICKAIIAAHDGRVGVKSAVGRGSTFWFTLPLATAS